MNRERTYEEILQACRLMMRHRQALAYPMLEKYVLSYVDVHTPNAALLSHIIAESLFRRLDSTLIEGKNIYVQKFDIPQITMFYKMAQAYPHIYVSHEIANQYLAQGMRHEEEVTLLDIGVGKGVQVQRLLTRLMLDQTCRIKRVHIIGMDPDRANVDDARAALMDLQQIVPFKIIYHPCEGCFEDLSLSELDALRRVGQGAFFVNAAYALHHTMHPPGDTSYRTTLVERLSDMRPRVFTLVEPSSDHDTESLSKRFHNCWQHFGTVYDLIDESGLSPAERFSIKETFVGREIRDMFGASDRFRCERHETYERWLFRLTRAGFSFVKGVDVEFSLPSYGESWVSDGLIRLGYNGLPLIAVFAVTADAP
ncbi:MAG: hypothetical protein H6739_16615 [Alphaproteobacteria bacterium]|nr:hypothetical protein [Alphaproteobacteria bacterium]